MAKSSDRERGATLVEAAFVTLPFMLVVFAILEFGLVFRADLTISNASTRASRAASVGGRAPIADFQIIEAVKDGLDDGGMENIQRVIVYRATSPNDPVPAGCDAITNPIGAQGVADVCNVYGPDALTAPLVLPSGLDNPEWQCAVGARDAAWCPTDRAVSFAAGPRDYVGVYVETTHNFITGFFVDSIELEANTVSRLEPETE
jgi:hypothetical protein